MDKALFQSSNIEAKAIHWIGFCFAFLCLVLLFSCSHKVRTTPYHIESAAKPTEYRGGMRPRNSTQPCHRWEAHLPDEKLPNALPMKYVRINFHIMNSADSSQSFTEPIGRAYMKELMETANEDLANNVRSWLSPEGIAVHPRMYRYVLSPQANDPNDDGIYFHYDDDHYYYVVSGKNQNNYNRDVIKKYTIGGDSIINVFVQVHHPDSLKSKHYRGTGQAIALGSAVKLSGLYELDASAPNFRGMFNHEFGHIFGLAHAWASDGCDDTFNHPNNCYAWEPNTTKRCSNNMMDYNAYEIAMTPCQIGKVNANFHNEAYISRKALLNNWCRVEENKDVVVQDSTHWAGARDLQGNVVVEPGGVLKISCRISMPEGTSITVRPKGSLILDGARLHNSCSYLWQGILQESRGKNKGEIILLETPIIENVVEYASKAQK